MNENKSDHFFSDLSMQIKEYPGYNFVGLLFGHSSDTQKRLEKVCTLGILVLCYGIYFLFTSITNTIFLALKL